MKLWLIERTDKIGWDENAGFVIRAETRQKARKIAAASASDEGPEIWLDTCYSTCKELLLDGEEGVVLSDFNAG